MTSALSVNVADEERKQEIGFWTVTFKRKKPAI